jgi:hypothetical protein
MPSLLIRRFAITLSPRSQRPSRETRNATITRRWVCVPVGRTVAPSARRSPACTRLFSIAGLSTLYGGLVRAAAVAGSAAAAIATSPTTSEVSDGALGVMPPCSQGRGTGSPFPL